MFIVYNKENEVITICSSEKSLYLATKDLAPEDIKVEKWMDCPDDILRFVQRA